MTTLWWRLNFCMPFWIRCGFVFQFLSFGQTPHIRLSGNTFTSIVSACQQNPVCCPADVSRHSVPVTTFKGESHALEHECRGRIPEVPLFAPMINRVRVGPLALWGLAYKVRQL